MKNVLFVVLVVLLALVVPLAHAQPPDDLEPDTWNVIAPGGETGCSDGSEFQFFARPGADADKLMIYFQGGGACWNAFTCAGEFHDRGVGTPQDELGAYQGIFDYENPENPLAGYAAVFIPYCTADVHTGDATVEYSPSLSIAHNGVANAQAALDWAYAQFGDVAEILVTGSSAGAIGAVYFAPQVMAQYPDAAVRLFGDGEVGAAPDGWSVLETWNMYANLLLPEDADPETFTINDIYLAIGALYPQHPLAQFTTTGDTVQITFYDFSIVSIGAGQPDWIEVMNAFLDELEAALPDQFRAFVAGGEQHTILATPGFYSIAIDGVRFVEWFTAWLNDEPVENLRCTECAEAEIVTP